MADPARPTVPDAAGVPPVNPPTVDENGIPITNDPNTITVVGEKTSDGPGVAQQVNNSWGIYDATGGAQALNPAPDSIRSVDDDGEVNVPRYPIEAGGFQSYNQVQTPINCTVTVTKTGDASARANFLAAIETLRLSLDLSTVITPEQTFRNMKLVRSSKRRSSESGVSMLSVELSFEEIRLSAQTAFVNVKAPSGASNVNGGSVQTQTPTVNQSPGAQPQ